MNDRNAVWDSFQPLWRGVGEEWESGSRPLLAHYTSLDVLEKMLLTNEIWFSNPLFMNDLEEVKFGILRGVRQLLESQDIRDALGTDHRIELFDSQIAKCVTQFEEQHLFDTYIFCLSEHPSHNQNGLLSMWRGYGRNGNGAAVVFDTARIKPIPSSPLIVGKVEYGTSSERLKALDQIAKNFAAILKQVIVANDLVSLAATALFERLKFFALFTKHDGFSEEREWRIVYMPERDAASLLKPMLHYLNGLRGVEPKLRLKVAPIEGVIGPELNFESIIDRVILGPSMSSALAERSVRRMFDILGRSSLKDKVISSEIPLRATAD